MRAMRNTSAPAAERHAISARRSEHRAPPRARLARRVWAAYWHRQIRRTTAQLPCLLDAHVLRDLGIRHDEICLYVHGRPSRKEQR